MVWVKGQSGNPNGKVKGTVTKQTSRFKEALNDLLEKSSDHMVGWLEKIAEESPEKAFAVLRDFAEYIHPKLSRAEHVGEDGGDIVLTIKKEIIDARDQS